MKLLIEDHFPTLEVTTTTGDMTLPDVFAGRWFVFFSHPGDFTPVCTTEFVGFQKRTEEFEALDTALIGLSVDTVDEHHSWVKWIADNLQVGVDFPIIGDKVLVPPTTELSDTEAAEQHVTQLSDWFRYRAAV